MQSPHLIGHIVVEEKQRVVLGQFDNSTVITTCLCANADASEWSVWQRLNTPGSTFRGNPWKIKSLTDLNFEQALSRFENI